MKNGITILELIVAIVIIGIVAALAMPAYNRSRENTFNNIASADLKLVVMAEKDYRYEMGSYYYTTAGTPVQMILAINNNLSLNLAAGDTRPWNYTATSTNCTQATRSSGTVRYWHMNFTGDTTPQPTVCP